MTERMTMDHEMAGMNKQAALEVEGVSPVHSRFPLRFASRFAICAVFAVSVAACSTTDNANNARAEVAKAATSPAPSVSPRKPAVITRLASLIPFVERPTIRKKTRITRQKVPPLGMEAVSMAARPPMAKPST